VGLKAILDAIHLSAEDQVRQIEQRTEIQVNEITTAAHENALQLREESCSAASVSAAAERARIMHQARVQALQVVAGARETLNESAMARTKEYLAHVRSEDVYPATLRRLFEEALNELTNSTGGPEGVCVECDPRDQVLLDETLRDLQVELTRSCALECWGGVIVKSADGRVAADNTLEARLERAVPYLRRCLATIFENEYSPTLVVENQGRHDRF